MDSSERRNTEGVEVVAKGTKGAALCVSGDGAVTLKGAGDPSGITVFADPQNTAGIAIADGATASITGHVYAPAGLLSLTGAAKFDVAGTIAVATVRVTDGATLTNTAPSHTSTVTYAYDAAHRLTKVTGAATSTYAYTANGQLTTHTGTADTPLRWNGQYQDTSGLYYLRARYYDAATAQFITRDPLQSVTQQAFAYAGDNPLNAADPLGLCDSNVFSTGFLGDGNCLSGLVGGPDGAGGETVGGVIKSIAGITGGAAAVVGLIATGGLGAGATEVFVGGAEDTFVTFEGGFVWTNGATAAAEVGADASFCTGLASGVATGAVDCSSGISAACVWDALSTGAGLGLARWPGGAIAAWLGIPLLYPWDTVGSSC